MSTAARWILAFDASCETCREISAHVSSASDRKLEVLPLNHPDVQRWRQQGLGAQPPWAPTLLKVTGDHVRAWTGAAMSVRLASRLGPRSTVRVLQSLGQLRRKASGDPWEPEHRNEIGLAQFIHLAAGAALVAGMILARQTPPLGEGPRSWVEANKDRLPQDYKAITEYPMAYRRAIYAELSPAARSNVWVEHLNRYQAAHPDLSAQQRTVIADATTRIAEPSIFDPGPQSNQLQELKDTIVAAFGQDEAILLIGTVGPVTAPGSDTQSPGGCTCNLEDDWCNWGYHCREGDCSHQTSGCGWWLKQPCNALCYD
jgi:hypothetical protein